MKTYLKILGVVTFVAFLFSQPISLAQDEVRVPSEDPYNMPKLSPALEAYTEAEILGQQAEDELMENQYMINYTEEELEINLSDIDEEIEEDFEEMMEYDRLLTALDDAYDAALLAKGEVEEAQAYLDQLEQDIILQDGIVTDWANIVSGAAARVANASTESDREQAIAELDEAMRRYDEELEILRDLQDSVGPAEEARDDAEDTYLDAHDAFDAALQAMLDFDPEFDRSPYEL